jgi:hypothetical protein
MQVELKPQLRVNQMRTALRWELIQKRAALLADFKKKPRFARS